MFTRRNILKGLLIALLLYGFVNSMRAGKIAEANLFLLVLVAVWALRYDKAIHARWWLLHPLLFAAWVGGFELWSVAMELSSALLNGAIPEVQPGNVGFYSDPVRDLYMPPAEVNASWVNYAWWLAWRVIHRAMIGFWFGVLVRGVVVAASDIKILVTRRMQPG